MAVTYFGNCDSSGNPTSNDGNWNPDGFNADWMPWTNEAKTCPGSGDQTIRQISVYGFDAATPGATVRLGVYNTSNELVADCGTASLTATSAAWTSVGDGSTSNLGTLTGGTDYYLACAFSGAAGSYAVICYTTGSGTEGKYVPTTDYGAGLPATLPSSSSEAKKWIIRVGVEAATAPAAPRVRVSWLSFETPDPPPVGHKILYRSDRVEYDSLKHSLLIDDVWEDRGSASVSAKGVTSLTGGMPVLVTCNTISSITFSGSVRGWSWRQSRASESVTYDIDIDDGRPYLDRDRFCRAYNSVAIDSIARDLVSTYASSFSTSGIHSMMSQAGSLTWTRVTVQYQHNATISEALDSLVAMAVPPDVNDPPVWGVTPDRVVRLVGAGNSYGTTVTVDDADLNLRTFELSEIANSLCTRVYIWGGSATVVTSLAAGANSLRTYHNEAFWGVPTMLSYPISSLYVAVGAELIPVVQSNTATGDQHVIVSSLNIDGAAHSGAPMNSIVRAVLVQTAPSVTTNITSTVTGESGIFSAYYDYAERGWPESPIDLNSIANTQFRVPGSELGMLRLTTTNSQVAAGGRLVVSLTAAGARRGVYRIQRVRIAGFERGPRAAPIYDVEAGAYPRYRINSLL